MHPRFALPAPCTTYVYSHDDYRRDIFGGGEGWAVCQGLPGRIAYYIVSKKDRSLLRLPFEHPGTADRRFGRYHHDHDGSC